MRKKLLIKAVSIAAMVIMLIGITVGCDQPTGDTEMTLGVATIDSVAIATPDQATTAPTVKPTVAPTTKPTEAPTEKPTEAPTEAPTDAPVNSYDDNDYDDDDYDYNDYNYGNGAGYDDSDESDYTEPNYDDSDDYESPASSTSAVYSAYEFQMRGVINWGGWTWTYYSENILPGDGLYLPGRHTDSDGYICDGDGYICLASSSLAWGTVVDTPFGRQGKVYDSGCASHILDVYTNW
jgi:hypothetical protein